MTSREESLYWKGSHFPTILTETEREEWARIKNSHERSLTDEEENFWNKVWLIYCMILCTIAVIAV